MPYTQTLRPLTLLACALTVSHYGWASPTQRIEAIANNSDNFITFSNATLMLSPGKTLQNASITIRNKKIFSISDSNEIPEGSLEINLDNKIVYPGFIDPYTSYGIDWQYSEYEGDGPHYLAELPGAKIQNRAIHADMKWQPYFKADTDIATSWVNNGFTSVQSSHFDGIFQGQSLSASLSKDPTAELIYPVEGAQFLSFSKGSSEQEYPSSLMGSIALIRQTLKDARWYQQQQTGNQKPELNQSLESLSHFGNQRVIFSVKNTNHLPKALAVLAPFHSSPILVGTGLEYERLNELQDAQLILPLTQARKPELASGLEINLTQLRQWERSPANLALVAKSGIPFAITQHGIDSKKFWPRLRTAIQHGLPQDTALAALTTNAAKYAGIDSFTGKLTEGYRADLVIASGNLFTDGEIEQIYIQGRPQLSSSATTQGLQDSYQLTLNGNALKLNLDLTSDDLSAQLQQGDTNIALENLNWQFGQLQGLIAMEALGLSGIGQFNASFSAARSFGQLIDANGKVHQFELMASQSTNESKDAASEPEPKTLISRSSWPNNESGLTAPLSAESVHIKNATIWTSADDGVMSNADIIIEAGKIIELGNDLSTPSGFTVIDASGKHLTPGLIDEHSHIAITGGVNEASDSNTAEVRIGDALNAEDIHIYRALAGGVTTAQLLHGSANVIGGQSQIIKLRWGEDEPGLKFTQAPASIKFALGENVKQSNWGDNYVSRFPQTRMGVEAYLTDQFSAAKEHKAALLAYDDLSRRSKRNALAPRPNERLETLIEILEGSRNIHVHSYVQSEILMLLRLSQELGFHVQTFTHILEGYKVADEMAEYGTTASTFSDWWAYKFEVYDAIPQNACLMQSKGVNTSINSDSADLIRKLNQEAAKSMLYCDMSAEDALKMVTINPAKQLKVDELTGSLEVGKQADLVLWDQAPLSVYAKVESTWVDGVRRFDRDQDQLQRKAAHDEYQALLQKLMASNLSGDVGEELVPEPEPLWHCDSLIHHHNHQHSH